MQIHIGHSKDFDLYSEVLAGYCRFQAEAYYAHWQRRNAHKETTEAVQMTLNSGLD